MSRRDVGEGHLGLDAPNGGRGEAAIAAGVPVFDDGDAVVALRGVAQRRAEGSGVAVAPHGLFWGQVSNRKKTKNTNKKKQEECRHAFPPGTTCVATRVS